MSDELTNSNFFFFFWILLGCFLIFWMLFVLHAAGFVHHGMQWLDVESDGASFRLHFLALRND